jgi:putative DNA primase/helicase
VPDVRQDFFAFMPQFTIIIHGDHKPRLGSIYEAIKRRMQLVPFTVKVPKEERDLKLGEKLRAEWPGILAWMVEGSQEWHEKGLAMFASALRADMLGMGTNFR